MLGNTTDHGWALPLRRWAATAVFGQEYRNFTDRNLLDLTKALRVEKSFSLVAKIVIVFELRLLELVA